MTGRRSDSFSVLVLVNPVLSLLSAGEAGREGLALLLPGGYLFS